MPLDFDGYQAAAKTTAMYPRIYMRVLHDGGQEVEQQVNFVYPALGLSGETGETLEKLKKVLRDNGGILSDENKLWLKKELGDVLWYVATIATEANLSLQDVAETNVAKLKDRKERNALHGSGDGR